MCACVLVCVCARVCVCVRTCTSAFHRPVQYQFDANLVNSFVEAVCCVDAPSLLLDPFLHVSVIVDVCLRAEIQYSGNHAKQCNRPLEDVIIQTPSFLLNCRFLLSTDHCRVKKDDLLSPGPLGPTWLEHSEGLRTRPRPPPARRRSLRRRTSPRWCRKPPWRRPAHRAAPTTSCSWSSTASSASTVANGPPLPAAAPPPPPSASDGRRRRRRRRRFEKRPGATTPTAPVPTRRGRRPAPPCPSSLE